MKVKNNYGYELNLVGAVEKIDNGIIEKLKQYDDTIYFNDLDSNYWMFDFKINDLWFSSKNIDLVKNKITLEVFN
ncbi:hypothetical protein [Clostridium sp.]|uniref:hypothetical protein n=1 Tax=Clostridium sp. TaxID=1506 RepID=UPI00290F5C55|nr:hypothetical protein [Clostridium sp.]MDU3410056.1 hypothetical protein [Clostridium sp.]